MLSDSLGDATPWAVDNLMQRIPGPTELLFDYLAEEVFLRQTPEVRRFLAESACLRRLDADACDDALEVTAALQECRRASVIFSQDIRRGGERLLTATVRVAALGTDFRPTPIPQPLYDELNALVEKEA